MGMRHAIAAGSLCALLAAPVRPDLVPQYIAQLPEPVAKPLVSEPIEPLPADDKTVVRRLGAICEHTLSATVTYMIGPLLMRERTSAFTFLRANHDYLLVGIPSEMSTSTIPEIELENGVRVHLVDRLLPTIAIARADRGSVPLLREVKLGDYSTKMTVSRQRLLQCEGVSLRAETAMLSPEDAFLKVECEQMDEYRGPGVGFSCPVIDDVRVWSFMDIRFVGYHDVNLEMIPPSQYWAIADTGSSGDRWTELLGVPVFAPDRHENDAIGVVIEAKPTRGKWVITLSPADLIVTYAAEFALELERRDKTSKTNSDSPSTTVP